METAIGSINMVSYNIPNLRFLAARTARLKEKSRFRTTKTVVRVRVFFKTVMKTGSPKSRRKFLKPMKPVISPRKLTREKL
jgi:hypothetical protein